MLSLSDPKGIQLEVWIKKLHKLAIMLAILHVLLSRLEEQGEVVGRVDLCILYTQVTRKLNNSRDHSST